MVARQAHLRFRYGSSRNAEPVADLQLTSDGVLQCTAPFAMDELSTSKAGDTANQKHLELKTQAWTTHVDTWSAGEVKTGDESLIGLPVNTAKVGFGWRFTPNANVSVIGFKFPRRYPGAGGGLFWWDPQEGPRPGAIFMTIWKVSDHSTVFTSSVNPDAFINTNWDNNEANKIYAEFDMTASPISLLSGVEYEVQWTMDNGNTSGLVTMGLFVVAGRWSLKPLYAVETDLTWTANVLTNTSTSGADSGDWDDFLHVTADPEILGVPGQWGMTGILKTRRTTTGDAVTIVEAGTDADKGGQIITRNQSGTVVNTIKSTGITTTGSVSAGTGGTVTTFGPSGVTATGLASIRASAANNDIFRGVHHSNGSSIFRVSEDASGHGKVVTTTSAGTTVNTLDSTGVTSTELLQVVGTGDRRAHIETTSGLNAAYMRVKNPVREWDIVLDGGAGSVPGALSFQDNTGGYARPFHINPDGVKIGGTNKATMVVYDHLYQSSVSFASSALADETKSTSVCTLQLKCVRVGQQVTICLDNGPDTTFDLTTDGAGYLKMKQVDVAAFSAAGSGRFLPNVNVFVPIIAYPGNGAATACLMVIFTTGDIYLYGNTGGGSFPASVSLVRFISTQYIKNSGY